jgi:transposase-like protein
MAKYGYEFKLEVVEYYLESGSGYTFTSNKFQVDRSSLYKWVLFYRQHGPGALTKHTYTSYTPQFKSKVIAHMRTHRLSIKQTAAHFNIPAFSTITDWEKLYDQGKILVPSVRRVGRKAMAKPTPPPEKPLEKMSHEELLAEARYLRTEHAYLKKAGCLDSAQAITRQEKAIILAELRPHHLAKDLIRASGMARSSFYYRQQHCPVVLPSKWIKGHMQSLCRTCLVMRS